MRDAANALGERIAAVLALDPVAPAIEFERRWRRWGELGATAESVAAALPVPGTRVGILLRNRPAEVAFLLGALRAGACVVAIDPQRGVERTRREIASLALPCVAGEPDDLERLVGPDVPSSTLSARDAGDTVELERRGRADDPSPRAGVAVQMLTSGTTGPPKRVDLAYEMLRRVLVGAKHYESDRDEGLRLRAGVAVVNSPLVHLGGLFRVLQCVSDGRSFALLERFTVDAWVDAVRRHRPATASLVPAALRMVLEADVDPAHLSSVRSVVSGTAPLSADDAEAFMSKYGIPVLGSYAATEFGGGVAGWNLADHRQFWSAKRGSVGRAHAGCALRVVDPADGGVLGPDAEGLLEVKAAQLGADAAWIRTTDLARIDADGFLWIVGRADRVIIRGGFKVHPDHVRATLERHPRVRGAAVVGRVDARLGAVPVAAVELRDRREPVTADDLLAHAAATLARYELPAEIRIIDALPRTASAKVDLAAVSALFGEVLTMDLRYSREDEAFRAEVRAWLEVEVPAHGPPPPSDDWPARRAYDTAWQRKLHDAGLAGIAWPNAFGGRGLPISQQLVYLEEYARAGAPYIGVNFVGLMHAGPTLIAEGSDAQRAFHLPRILKGESVWCQGFSEPQAGSDLASLRTRAERRGDEYVVSGQKIWSTRAHVADYCELLVRTDADAAKHAGITWLILDMHQPRVTVRPMRTIDGERHFCEVFLDEARVPIENRVGAENDGWRVANVTLRFERGTAFAQHIITLRSQVLRLASLAKSRRRERGTASDDLRRRIGRLDASVEALWRMTQMCVSEAERTGAPSPLGSAVKLRYSELSQEITELAVRLVGRSVIGGAEIDGVRTDDVAREYLWSLQATIAAGTSQIQRNLIAQRILGMPKGR